MKNKIIHIYMGIGSLRVAQALIIFSFIVLPFSIKAVDSDISETNWEHRCDVNITSLDNFFDDVPSYTLVFDYLGAPWQDAEQNNTYMSEGNEFYEEITSDATFPINLCSLSQWGTIEAAYQDTINFGGDFPEEFAFRFRECEDGDCTGIVASQIDILFKGNSLTVQNVSTLFTALPTGASAVIYESFLYALPITAGLIGLGFAISRVRRYIARKA